MKMTVAMLLLSACAAATPDSGLVPASAGFSLWTVETHYDISGATVDALQSAMLLQGPRIEDWPLYAYTEWEVHWRLGSPLQFGRSHLEARQECRFPHPQVDLITRTVLPNWTAPPGATDALRAQWNSFLLALNAHEVGHHNLGVQAASEVLRALRDAHAPRCNVLAAVADSAAHFTLYRYNEQNVQYDQTTQYGRLQGVIWPPPNPTKQ